MSPAPPLKTRAFGVCASAFTAVKAKTARARVIARIHSSLVVERGLKYLPVRPRNSSLNEHRHHFVRQKHSRTGQPEPVLLLSEDSGLQKWREALAETVP